MIAPDVKSKSYLFDVPNLGILFHLILNKVKHECKFITQDVWQDKGAE